MPSAKLFDEQTAGIPALLANAFVEAASTLGPPDLGRELRGVDVRHHYI
jgi:hypothetical protein